MIRKLILAVLAIVVLAAVGILAATLIAPTEFRVEREMIIAKPAPEIYSYARMLKNQNDWGPWYKKEPTMRQEFRGTDGEVGFVSYWKGTSEQVGEGEQEIKALTPNSRIDTELRFIQPFESKADAYLVLEPVNEGQTNVKWGFTGSMPRPMNAMLLFIDMDKEVGKDFAEGLAGLKARMEAR